MRLHLMITILSVSFVAVCMFPTNCADIGAGEPVVTVDLAVTEPPLTIEPDTNSVYQINQRTWYTLEVTTDDPTDTIGEIVFIGNGPELGWRGFRYLLLDIAENGSLRTASVTITRDGREFTKEIVFQVSYSIP